MNGNKETDEIKYFKNHFNTKTPLLPVEEAARVAEEADEGKIKTRKEKRLPRKPIRLRARKAKIMIVTISQRS
jgi:hypothetical protein